VTPVHDGRVSRRTVLGAGASAALGLSAAPMLGGCGSLGDTIEVLVVWSGAEYNTFRRLMDRFERDRKFRWRVDVVTAGDQIDALLAARVHNPPDLAVLSQPRLIRRYACDGRLVDPALPDDLADRVPPYWRRLATVRRKQYGVWVKASHKSLFWYRQPYQGGGGAARPPTTWLELVGAASASGVPPLSIGAADGWVLSDWFENALVTVNGQVYRELSADPTRWKSYRWAIQSALSRLGDVWSPPNAFPYDAERMLLTQYEESVGQVFDTGKARMVFEGDFLGGVGAIRRAGGDAKTFRFPTDTATPSPPIVAGGDAAVLMRDSDGGRELMKWLASPRAHLRAWASTYGILSPGLTPEDYPVRSRAHDLATDLNVASAAGQLYFDMSDQVGGALAGSDGRGIWRILQRFFAAVAGQGRSAVPPAVGDAVDELIAAAESVNGAGDCGWGG
jgi:ABC-type glycerol-3-phosphate transport system substrate-binding protein